MGASDLARSPFAAGVVVGREPELALLERFFAPDNERGCLALVGEAGVGKTTLWEWGVDVARERGLLVALHAREAEARLSFAGLADLLDGMEWVFAEVPAPQRHALEVVLYRAEATGPAPDPFAIAAGFLSALRVLTVEAELVVAVDDVSWLDAPSAEALMYAARRLGSPRMRILLSRRAGELPEFEQVFAPGGAVRVEVGPLSFGAITRLMSERLERRLPRPLARRVFDVSGGNPLFALELGRSVLERGSPQVGAELPLPAALEEAFATRVSALSPSLRRVLLALALSASLTRTELAKVVDPLAIEDALSSGLALSDGARLRPSHPLLAAAAAQGSSARDRQELHLLLAEAAADPLLRARHRAMAAPLPDAALAAEVAAAASAASQRGAFADAVELSRHALRLTPADASEWGERVLAHVRTLITVGDIPRATELLHELIERLPSGPLRATARLLLSEAAGFTVEEEQLEHAIEEGAGEPELLALALARRAMLLVIKRVERVAEAERLALMALESASAGGLRDEPRLLLALAWARVVAGRPIDDLLVRASSARDERSLYETSLEIPLGIRLSFRGECASARALFRRLASIADDRGEARSLFSLQFQLIEFALRAGDTEEAGRMLDECEDWAGLEQAERVAVVRALLGALHAAVKGFPQRARELASVVDEASESDRRCYVWDRIEALRARGLADLYDREGPRAVESLGAVWEHTVREGVDDPGAFPIAADLVEALIESGRSADAHEVLARLRRLAVEQAHPWALATSDRCEASLALSERYDERSAAALVEAAEAYGRLGNGFDRARSLLFLGRVQRRAKRRGDARRSFEDAISGFDALGAEGWGDLARAELARVSGRRSTNDGVLTRSEHAVAELAAQGLSNKEIAARLFVSVSTVEAHLRKCYAKLGIRSRTQLAARLASLS